VRTAKPCGPGRRCYGQAFAEVCASPTGQTASSKFARRGRPKRTRLPGEHGISRPTVAQGRPSDWLHLYAAVRFSCVCFSRSGPRVPAGTRPSLRPLGYEGGVTKQSSGETRRENEKSCPLFECLVASCAATSRWQALRMNCRSDALEVPVQCHQWPEHDPPGVRGPVARDQETFSPSSRTGSSDRLRRSIRRSDWSPAPE
jgi:hypothetical protein